MVVGSKGPAAPTGPESPAGPIDDKAHRPSRRRPGRQLLVPATLEAAGMESPGLDSPVLETVQALRIEALTRLPRNLLIRTREACKVLSPGGKLGEPLGSVRYVVVDETPELAAEERGAHRAVALERLRDLRGREFQRMGLSATVGTPAEV